MIAHYMEGLIQQGESITREFKACRNQLTKDVYPTVGAFLNRNGGHLLIGVTDQGDVVGVNESHIQQIKKDFANTVNNEQKLQPAIYLALEEVVLQGKVILHTYVPPSSSVHRVNGKIYDRNEDADLDITHSTLLVAEMYLRKQESYTENRIYPYLKLQDLRIDLIEKARQMAINRRVDHPWANLAPLELLKSARLYQRNHQSNQEGLTLAGILLFGQDEVIGSVLPHFKIDLIKRVIDVDRYDDREILMTNLMDSYEKVMAFVQKHLPDPFCLEGINRISLRDKVFREIVSNLLIHREYMNGAPARLIIESNKIVVTNANRPHGFGRIDLGHYEPFPKNPNIASVFREIGRAEELGSGVKNLYKYCKQYTGADPILLEQDLFKIEMQLPIGVLVSHATPQVEKISEIIIFCQQPRSRKEIMSQLGLQDVRHFREAILNPLLAQGVLILTIPARPTSPNQKYQVR